ncbi:MAG: beta strand repeat-containing protein [Bacteroidota bacterium]
MLRTSAISMRRKMFSLMMLAIVSSGILSAQNIVNTGTFTNNSGGTLKIKGTFSSTQAAYGGTVEFTGTAQSVPALTYANLKATGASGSKTFAGSTTISGDVTVNQASGGFVLAATDTLTLSKITTVPVTVTSGSFDVSAGTTKYANGVQVLYGTTYGNLITSGGNKTTGGAVTVSSGKTLTNSVTLDFGANAFTGTGATFANTGTLQSAGAVTLGSGTSVNGTFAYNAAAGSQSVANATYSGTLALSGAATKTVGNVNLTGTYTAAGGARTYDGTFTYAAAGAQTIVGDTYDSLALSGSGTKSVSGTTVIGTNLTASVPVSVPGSTTLQLAASSTASFSDNLAVDGSYTGNAAGATTIFNGGAQTISGGAASLNFTNLTLSGTAAKTASLTLNVSGTLTPTRGIDMGSTAVMNITNTAAGAVGSFGSLEMIKGTMKRAIATNGAAYAFNDSATSVTFTGATITDFTMKVEPGVNPTGYTAATHVNRKVTTSYTGWSAGSAAITVGYLNSEKPSQDENKTRFFKGAGVKLATGSAAVRTNAGATSWGAIALSGITSGVSAAANAQLPTGTELIMSNSGASLISIAAADWNTASTWDEGYVPTINDDVEVNHNVSINANGSASSLVVNATKTLTLATNGTILTVNGATTNNGSIAVGTGTTLKAANSGTGTFTNAGTVTNDGTVQVGN